MVWIADRRWICAILLALMATLACESAIAARPPEPEVARCIRQAARGQSWLEKTLWGLRDQEAGWIGAEILNKDGSHDLGPLQINSWWVPRIAALLARREGDVRRWLQFDPCFNAEAARWIFLDALKTGGSYWKAVGIYHSPNDARQRRYAALVAVHLQKRFGADVFGWRTKAGSWTFDRGFAGQRGPQVGRGGARHRAKNKLTPITHPTGMSCLVVVARSSSNQPGDVVTVLAYQQEVARIGRKMHRRLAGICRNKDDGFWT